MADKGKSASKRGVSPKQRGAKTAPASPHFAGARVRAERLLHDPEAAAKLVAAAEKKADGTKKSSRLAKVIKETKAMLRLISAYVKGDYRAVSWESMVLIVAAMVYLVSPIDLIPDFLPAGLADDATVILFVVTLVHEELEDFMVWETRRDDGPSPAAVPA